MDLRRIFINLMFVVCIGVIGLSVFTLVKRGNEPKEEFVAPEHTQTEFWGNETEVDESSETVEVTETTESTETTENSESEEQEGQTGEEQEGQDVQDVQETRTLYVQERVNVRSGPGTAHSLLGGLSRNTEVTAIGEVVDGWQKILYDGEEAYVSAEYLGEERVQTQNQSTRPNAGTTQPTDPETTHPTDPGTTQPTDPGTTQPTDPETTQPTDPETTQPTDPETTQPTDPETTQPTDPETTQPTDPGTTQPTDPGTTQPADPGTDPIDSAVQPEISTDPAVQPEV